MKQHVLLFCTLLVLTSYAMDDTTQGQLVFVRPRAQSDSAAQITVETIDCPICFGPVTDRGHVKLLCGHTMHLGCYEQCQNSGNSNCGMCRRLMFDPEHPDAGQEGDPLYKVSAQNADVVPLDHGVLNRSPRAITRSVDAPPTVTLADHLALARMHSHNIPQEEVRNFYRLFPGLATDAAIAAHNRIEFGRHYQAPVHQQLPRVGQQAPNRVHQQPPLTPETIYLNEADARHDQRNTCLRREHLVKLYNKCAALSRSQLTPLGLVAVSTAFLCNGNSQLSLLALSHSFGLYLWQQLCKEQ